MVLRKWVSPLKDKYPTMSIDELCDMNIKLSYYLAEDCGLFLWATHTTLPDAFRVMKKWGFNYHCLITWDKGNGWSSHGFHRKTEMLLYGYRGTMNINQTGKFIPTLISERKTTHSTKPQILYEILEHNTPEPRLELFARKKREGWDCWGNEVESDIQL
jgi:N6-adenosine-specific RNA methylase IME4